MQWPFQGRQAELRAVGEALADGASTGVVIAGPSGVGKTRLATEAAGLAQGCCVEWVRASGSSRAIPLGAFAPLLPVTELPLGAELLARARHALAERAAGRRLVLCVDDGHQLDDTSATLVHQLVAAGEVFAVVTVRRDLPVPDALRALWKDDRCVRLELDALSRDEVRVLLEAGLAGPMDGGSTEALWELTRGNVLFLRELVRHGLDRGLLSQDGEVWRWRGPVRAGMRLAELVGLRIADVGDDGRAVLELVAVGAPLEVEMLEPPERAALAVLERAELVERRTDERRRMVDIAHPLHGEAVRARLTPTRLEAIYARLADGMQALGDRRSGDLLRTAVWRLEAGSGGDAGLFVQAADQALAGHDAELAARLARAAGACFDAQLTLGRALARGGQMTAAEVLLADLAARAETDWQRTAVAMAAARNLFWGLDRGEEADAVLRDAERRVTDDALRYELTAQRVRFTAGHGRPAAALAAAQPLLGNAALEDRARTTVAMGAVEALFSSGRADAAVALVETALPVARRCRAELPYAEPVLLGMRAMTQRVAGRLVEATALSEENYELLLRRRTGPATAVEATSLGLIWLARGRVRTALRFCREGASLLRDADVVGMLAFALAGVAQSAAQAGDAEVAQDAVTELDRTPLGHKAFAVELELARAWTAAARGLLSLARDGAAAASELALARGQDAYAVPALHALCRLGDPAAAAGDLALLAGRVDGPLAPAAAAHAAALVDGDGTALLEVAERFADADALLVAAEAAEAAAAAFHDAGREASARAAAARAGRWMASCEGARPPTMLASPKAADLTPREREVALLAAGGASSREIADHLVISVRTVDNHLASAFRKLDVTRRQDLAGVLLDM